MKKELTNEKSSQKVAKFLDKNGHDKYELKGLCDTDKMEQYKGQELYVIMSHEEDKIQRFSCFLIKK